MRIVLGEPADPGQPVQFPVLLVAVHRSKLGQPKGQIPVRTGLGPVNLAVMGAIHGLEQVLFALVRCQNGPEGILPVFVPMPGGLVKFFVSNMRRHHLYVTGFGLLPAQKLLQYFADHGAFGEP